jgi:hypothetical protein
LLQLKAFAESQGVSQTEALESKVFKDKIVKDMEAKAREYSLTSLEKIRKIHLTD